MTEQSMINIKIKFTSSIKTNNNHSGNIIINFLLFNMDIEQIYVSNSNLNLDIKNNFINVQFSTCALSEVNQIRYNYL